MACTTYETMCSTCKFHFVKLRQLALRPEHLETTQSTYPVAFNCHIKLNLPLSEHSLAKVDIDHGDIKPLQRKLKEHCETEVPVFTSCSFEIASGSVSSDEEETKNKRLSKRESHLAAQKKEDVINIYQSILIDFPLEIKGTSQWRSWIAEFVSVGVYEWDDHGITCKPKAYYTTKQEDWRVVRPAERAHGCWTRLQWFLRKAGLVPSI